MSSVFHHTRYPKKAEHASMDQFSFTATRALLFRLYALHVVFLRAVSAKVLDSELECEHFNDATVCVLSFTTSIWRCN